MTCDKCSADATHRPVIMLRVRELQGIVQCKTGSKLCADCYGKLTCASDLIEDGGVQLAEAMAGEGLTVLGSALDYLVLNSHERRELQCVLDKVAAAEQEDARELN